MANRCCRCRGEAEGRILLAIAPRYYAQPIEIEKDVCANCIPALEVRFREWCGETNNNHAPWLKKGYP